MGTRQQVLLITRTMEALQSTLLVVVELRIIPRSLLGMRKLETLLGLRMEILLAPSDLEVGHQTIRTTTKNEKEEPGSSILEMELLMTCTLAHCLRTTQGNTIAALTLCSAKRSLEILSKYTLDGSATTG
jgi:hypothetical protein